MDCLADGDTKRLHALGLGIREAALLRALTLEDLRRVSSMCVHALQVRFDPVVLGVVVERLKAMRNAEALQRSLVAADAPRGMMRELFGMGSREYGQLRRRLGVTAGAGRPPALDEATEHRLWHALAGWLRPDPTRPLAPEQFLEVHAETGVPLRAIWSFARQWADQPEPSPRR